MTHRSVMIIFAGLLLAMFLSSLDQTIVSTAMPTIAGDLGGADHISWIITAYALAISIGMPVYGKLGDQFGRKGLFITALSVFILGSILSGLSTTMGFLIFGRFVQGLGGAGLMILSQAILADIMSPLERAKYSGVMGAVFGVSAIAGPLLGGFLTEHLSWHWAFWINIPLGLFAIFIAVKTLHLPPVESSHKVDYWGMATLIPAVTSLILITTWGGTQYEWNSPTIIGLIAVCAVSTAIFILIERYAAEPIIPLSLFKSRTFTLAATIGLTIGAGTFAAMSYLPTYLQIVNGVSATESGLLMLPMLAGTFTSSIGSGYIISKTGKYKIFPILGMALAALGIYLFSTMTIDTSQLVTSIYMIITGLGMGLCMQTLVLVVQNSVKAKDVGAATATNNFFREIGISLGVSIFGSAFASRLADNLSSLGGGTTEGGLTPEAIGNLPNQIREVVIQGYVDSLMPAFVFLVPVVILGFIATLFIPQQELSKVSGAERRKLEQENNEMDLHNTTPGRENDTAAPEETKILISAKNMIN
ncbi:MAG: MFS transporter [Enterococcus sp.]|nr:MFS transporter [Enterococcus sp.]